MLPRRRTSTRRRQRTKALHIGRKMPWDLLTHANAARFLQCCHHHTHRTVRHLLLPVVEKLRARLLPHHCHTIGPETSVGRRFDQTHDFEKPPFNECIIQALISSRLHPVLAILCVLLLRFATANVGTDRYPSHRKVGCKCTEAKRQTRRQAGTDTHHATLTYIKVSSAVGTCIHMSSGFLPVRPIHFLLS